MIPYGRQLIDDDDVAAVVDVLRGDWLTQGPHVEEFERAIANHVGSLYAVAFSSGTAALHAAMVAAGIGPGSVVATSALTFVASANCGRYVGADVRLLDIDPRTLNLDSSRMTTKIDALVAVHYAGLPFDLASLDGDRPTVVIEDAAHALGATTADGPVGNCARSDLCMFSFHPVKAITCGEGGMITTNSPELDARLRRYRNHGIEKTMLDGEWSYEVSELGMNLRLTDLQAALGTSQLAKLDTFIARRNVLAQRYREALEGLPLTLPPAAPPNWTHAYHLFPIRVRNRSAVYSALREGGIAAQVHYVPVYHHPMYASAGGDANFPQTASAYSELVSLPLFPALTDGEQTEVIDCLKEVICALA